MKQTIKFFLISLCKKPPNTSLRSFLKQALTILNSLIFKILKVLFLSFFYKRPGKLPLFLRTLIVLFLLTTCHYSFAQTKIRGRIIDFETFEGIPFVSISFDGTSEGCVSDYNGAFFAKTDKKVKYIIINSIGYISDTIKIQANSYQNLDIQLKPDLYSISEIVVKPSKNPAIKLIKKVIRNKKKNNINRLNTYSYEQYSKVEVDLNNFNPKIADKKFMQDFSLAFSAMDTSAATGKRYIPLALSETLSDYYFQRFPRYRKEKIIASQISGIKNTSVSRFTGQMYVDFNFYKSYIKIMDKEFVSPLSLSATMMYDYFLIDTAIIDDSYCYHITFKPKIKHSYTFQGDMWIADTIFALKRIEARMSKTANVDFISDFYVKKNYTKIDTGFLFPAEEAFFIDFNISEITFGFFGKKYVSRKHIKINPKFPKGFFSSSEFRDIEISNNAGEYNSAEWEKMRHKELSSKEQQIYVMVNTVKQKPAYRKVENFIYLVGTGYLKRRYVELGPYYKIFSRNALEGTRFRLGARTSNKFSELIELNGYTAFGTRDKKIKYGTGAKIKIANSPWTLARINYSNDLIQLGANLGDFGSDNIFSVSGKNDKLLHIQNFETGIEHDLFKSLTLKVFYTQKKIMPTKRIHFLDLQGNKIAAIRQSEISLRARLGINEEHISSVFNRQSFGSLYPIIEIQYTRGIPDFLKSDYNYHKLTVGLRHFITYGFFGKTNYYVEAGKLFGNVPFPLLKLHEGSSGLAYDMYAFNLMNYYEFASNKYISFFAEHHFNGLILNKIPLLRKLELREVVYAKGVWGSLKGSTPGIMQFPDYMSDVKKPYLEIGLGIENIFNFLSINYFRRLTHIKKSQVRKNGIFLGFHVNF